MRRPGAKIGALVLVLVALVGGPVLYVQLATRALVRQIIASPETPLTPTEEHQVTAYMSRDGFFGAPWCKLSEVEQAELAKAVVERVARTDEASLLWALAEARYVHGLFPTLPDAINDAILDDKDNVTEMLHILYAHRLNGMAQHLNIDFIMLKGRNAQVIVWCFCAFTMPILNQHRGACIAMLKRSDVEPVAKLALLIKVTDEKAGAQWFSGREEMLEDLRALHNPRIDERIDEVLSQIRAQAETPTDERPSR